MVNAGGPTFFDLSKVPALTCHKKNVEALHSLSGHMYMHMYMSICMPYGEGQMLGLGHEPFLDRCSRLKCACSCIPCFFWIRNALIIQRASCFDKVFGMGGRGGLTSF